MQDENVIVMVEDFNKAIEAALQGELADSAREADLRISSLKEQLMKEEVQIKAAAVKERQLVEGISNNIEIAKEKLKQKFPYSAVIEESKMLWGGSWERSMARNKFLAVFNAFDPDLPLWPDEIWKNIAVFFSLTIVPLSLTIAILFLWGPNPWVLWMLGLWESISSSTITLMAIGLFAIFFLGSLFYMKLRNRQREKWITRAHDYKEELGLNMLEERLKEAHRTYSEALLRRGALPILREIINTNVQPSYDTTLPKIDSIGLAEVYDPEFEVPTPSKIRLMQVLNGMPGGSIGIAGPRGAGKSTLLYSFCCGGLTEFKGLPVLSILAPAPAEYQTRDFILHLFSQLTKQVLSNHKVSDTMQKPQSVFGHQDSGLRKQILSILLPLRVLIIYAAAMFLLIGMSVGIVQIYSKQYQSSATGLAEKTEGSQSPKEKSIQNSTQDRPVSKELPSAGTLLISKIVDVFGIKAGDFIFWGMILFAMGFAVQQYLFSERRNQDHWKNQHGGEDSDDMLSSYVKKQVEKEEQRPLVKAALKWHNDIKFQQSFTSGWSGSLNLPMGIGMGVNEARTFARYQMSLPEIVAGFRDFLTEATRSYQIFIGIDELDKIRTDDAARCFLNDIKVIFGVEKCFFLISISENAMSNFERRGLPFRDEFDSSFDDVVHVNYLDFEGASRLIKRRVIGMPVVFVGLCHSLTGGLARDLIRMCRALLAVANKSTTDRSISVLCSHLITQEVRTKLRALEIAIKNLEYTSRVTEVLAEIQNLKNSSTTLGSPDLKKISSDIESIFQKCEKPNKNDPVSAQETQLLVLTNEILSFLEYCSCVLDFFSKQLNEEKVRYLIDGDFFERFANVRQALAVDPALVVPMLRDIKVGTRL